MTARLMTVSRDFSLTFMHSKDVKLATEESTGFDEVLHNTATPPPLLSERSTCNNFYPSGLRSPTTGSSFSLS